MPTPVPQRSRRIACVGLVGRERISHPGGLIEGWGGAALYFAGAAVSTGAQVEVITSLTNSDRRRIERDLADLSSSILMNSVPTDRACRFGLTYDDSLDLADFEYAPGGAEDDRTAEDIVRRLDAALSSGTDHVHICPLPASLMDLVAPTVLSRPQAFSVQLHFSVISESHHWLQKLIPRATHVFMNRAEAKSLSLMESQPEVRAGGGSSDGATFVTDTKGVFVEFGRERLRFEATDVEALDPTGAGDAFAGGVIGRSIDGASLASSVNWGLALAALTVATASSHGMLRISQAGHRQDS